MASILARYAVLDKSLIEQKINYFCQLCAKFVSSFQKWLVIIVSVIFNEFYKLF